MYKVDKVAFTCFSDSDSLKYSDSEVKICTHTLLISENCARKYKNWDHPHIFTNIITTFYYNISQLISIHIYYRRGVVRETLIIFLFVYFCFIFKKSF